jgi:hypothetical protein
MQDCVQIQVGFGLTSDHILRGRLTNRMPYGDWAQHRKLLAKFAERTV